MNTGARLARLGVLASSVTLLTFYVVYSHQSAQAIAENEAETPELPQAKKGVVKSDPIAALAAFPSRDHFIRSPLVEEPVASPLLSGRSDVLWQPAMISRILNNHGNGSSSRMLSPKKLAMQYFQSMAAEKQSTQRMLMAGSKSLQVFTPSSPHVPSPVELPSPSVDLPSLLPSDTRPFDAEPVFEIEKLEPTSAPVRNTASLFDSLSKRPPDPLEEPQNIQRILSDDGSYFSESRKIIAPEKIAEARRYEKNPVYTSSCICKTALKGSVSDFFQPLLQLLIPLAINESSRQPLPQDFRLFAQ